MQIRAIQEVEPWTGPSLVFAVILLIATIALLAWLIRRFLAS